MRVMVSHNGQTRYIPTDIIIDSISEFKEGRVVKRPDKDILNLRLKKICDKYFERYMELEFSNCLTCSQLVRLITDNGRDKCHTFEEVVDEYLSQIDEEDRGKTYKLYRLAANKFIQFTGTGAPMEHITPIRINGYISALKKQRLSNTTINIYITLLKVLINYAKKMQYVNMCQFVICNSIVEMSLLKYYPYSQIQSLMDCGLLNSVACESSLTEKATEINGKSHSLKIISSQIDLTMIRFRDVFRLTDAGTQLYNITQVQTHKSYMIGLKEQLEIKYGLVLELVQISQ